MSGVPKENRRDRLHRRLLAPAVLRYRVSALDPRRRRCDGVLLLHVFLGGAAVRSHPHHHGGKAHCSGDDAHRQSADWGLLSAAGILTIVPGALVIYFVRNYILSALGRAERRKHGPGMSGGIRNEGCVPVGASVTRGGDVNGPAANYALRKYMEWLREYAPPGALGMDFYQELPSLTKGNVAQQIFWYSAFTANMLDPKEQGQQYGR